MDKKSWLIRLSTILLALSVVFYLIHYEIFRDAHHIFIYLLGDIAFVFIEVLLVTVIIHELINQHEKNRRLNKLNILVGTFFDELGNKILTYLSDIDPHLETIKADLVAASKFTNKEFDDTRKKLKKYAYEIDIQKCDLNYLKKLLELKSDFLLRLLENPNLLEHESFTELLQAIFHLNSELKARDSLDSLPNEDIKHLQGDIKRIYGYIVIQWLDYMRYLKKEYPYLYSLAMRTNPFDQDASAVIVEA